MNLNQSAFAKGTPFSRKRQIPLRAFVKIPKILLSTLFLVMFSVQSFGQIDTTPPFVDFGSEFTIELDENGHATVTVDAVGGDDFDDNGELLTFTFSQTDFDCSDMAAPTEVTIIVTNAAGISASTVMNAFVEDNMGPILVTNDVVIQLDANGNGTYTIEEVFSTDSRDNCGGAITFQIGGSPTVNQDDVANSPFTRTVKGQDQYGNNTRTRVTITVLDHVVDETPPTVITQDITVQLDATGNGSISASQIDNGSNDASGIASVEFLTSTTVGELITNGGFDSNASGWLAIGNDGNGGFRSSGESPGGFFVLNGVAALNADPSISQAVSGLIPGTIYTLTGDYRNFFGCCGAFVGQTSFGVDLDGAEIAAFPNPGTNFSPFSVSFTATAETQTIRFRSEINGTDTDMAIDNISISALAENTTASSIDYDCSQIGQLNEVTLLVTDVNGNQSTATANVTVEDNIDPALVGIPADVTVEFTAVPAVATVSATDNCINPPVTFTEERADGISNNNYTLTRTWTATDESGNAVSGTQVITVEDATAPIVITKDITVQLDENGNASITPEEIDNGSSDDSGGALTYSLDRTDFGCNDFSVSCSASSIEFNGSGIASGANGDNIQNLGLDQLTMEAWVKPNGGSVNSIIRKAGDYDLYIVNNIVYAEVWYEGRASSAQYLYTGPSVPSSGWSHLAFTFDKANNGTGKFYVNGIETVATGTTRSITPDITLGIGGSTEFGQSFTGLIDDVRIWSTERTSTEINEFKGFCIDANSVGLEAYFKIEANEGTTLTDYSGNGNHLTITGTSWSLEGAPIERKGVEVTLTVTDESNNASSAIANVIVLDNIAPTLVGIPTDVTVECDNVPVVAAVSAADNCTTNPVVTFTEERIDGISNNNYRLTRTWTTTDESGNTVSGTQVITVEDNIDPSITLNGDALIFHDAYADYIDLGATASDNCSTAEVSVDSPVDINTPGAYIVTYTATDDSGNQATVARTVIVRDITAPQVSTQPAITLLDEAGNGSISNNDVVASATDDSGTVNVSLSDIDFVCVDLGDNTVSLTGEDLNGNSIGLTTDGLVGYWKFGGANPLVDLTGNWGDIEFVGNASLNNGALDLNSNGFARTTGYNGQTITSKTLISYMTLEDLNVRSGAAISIDGVTTDNFDAIVYAERQVKRWMNGSSFFRRTQDLNPGFEETQTNQLIQMAITYENIGGQVIVSVYRNGVNIGGYTSANASNWTPSNMEILFGARHTTGNTQFGSMDARISKALLYNRALSAQEIAAMNGTPVSVSVVDEIAPTVVGKPIEVMLTASGTVSITSQDVLTSGSDNCGPVVYSLSQDTFGASDAINSPVTIQLIGTDPSGNAASVDVQITVIDPIPVVATQDITVSLDENGNVIIAPEQIDNGSSSVVGLSYLSLDITSFDCSNVGIPVTVTLTATSTSGSSASATAVVTVEDNSAPEFLTRESFIIFLDANGVATVSPDQFNRDTVTDNCGVQTITFDRTTFDCNEVGFHEINITATDTNGNVTVGQADVEVRDEIAPTVITQNIIIDLDANGNASISPSDVDNGTFDNCAFTLSLNIDSFTCAQVGENIVELTAHDQNGVFASANATVTVRDIIAPTVITKDVTVGLDANGAYTVTPDDINNGTFDNCTFDLSVTDNLFDCSTLGENTVILTATDASGNATSASATVTVVDNAGPVIIANDIDVFLNENGNASITLDDVNGGVTDGCGVTSTTIDVTSFDCSNLGANTVTLTATDIHGNTSTGTATVTVIDNIAPTVITKNITVDLDANGNANISPIDVLVQEETTEYCSVTNAGRYGMLMFQYVKRYRNRPNGRATAFTFITRGRTFRKNPDGTATITGTLVDRSDARDSWSVRLNLKNARDWEEWSALGKTYEGNRRIIGDKYLDWTYYEMGENSQLIGTGINRGETIQLAATSRGFQVGEAANSLNSNFGISGQFRYTTRRRRGSTGRFYFDLDNCISRTKTPEGPLTDDNCSIASTNLDITSFDCSNIGDNIVNVTVKDKSGNATTVPATVTVRDVTKPVARAKNITVTLGADGTVTIDPKLLDAGSTDNCEIVSYSLSRNTFTCRDIQNQSYYRRNLSIALIVTDAAGNSSRTVATVYVTERQAPVVSTEPITLVVYGRQRARASRREISKKVTDNCGVQRLYHQRRIFSRSNAGLNYLWVVAIDNSGNRTNGFVRVNVVDVTKYGRVVPMCYKGRPIRVRNSQVKRWLSRGASIGTCSTDITMTADGTNLNQQIAELEPEPVNEPIIELGAYPNPSQGMTNITFSSDVAGPAQMIVVSTGGVRMTTLFDGDIAADQNVKVRYNTHDLPSGMYIIRLVTAGEIRSLKLIVKK